MKIIIVGAGDIGKSLVNILSAKGHDITLVESDKDRAESSAQITDALVLMGEPTDMKILKDAGIDKADAVICLTKDDKSNLMVSEIAKSLNVKKIISRVSDPENEELFTKLGIVELVPIVGLALTKIENILSKERYRVLAELGKGSMQIIESVVHRGSKYIGKEMVKEGIISAVYRNGDYILADHKIKIAEGDVLMVTIKPHDVQLLIKKLNEA